MTVQLDQKVTYACGVCGSSNVTSDTIASWDVASQRWEVIGHYDSSECADCQEPRTLTASKIPNAK
jgi:hypothetical protein